MLRKYSDNPVVRPADVTPSREGFIVLGAFNPGATIFNDQVILLLRVAESCEPAEGRARLPVYRFDRDKPYPDILEFDTTDPDVELKDSRGVVHKGVQYLSTMSHIRLARSRDGKNFTVDERPFIYPTEDREKYGCEDARVVRIGSEFYINFTVISGDSWSTMLASTRDFKETERKGIIFHPENKDVAIFPEKINGMYHALHRPNNSGFGKASIWYAESPDLVHWGDHRCVARPRDISHESMKIGGGAPPIRTDEGWLSIYHGKGDSQHYSLFAMLHDLSEPWKVIKRGETPILEPTEKFETDGFFDNVVFTNGIVEKDGQLYVYYGAADESVGLATSTVDEILATF